MPLRTLDQCNNLLVALITKMFIQSPQKHYLDQMEMSFHKKVASKNYPKVQLVGFYRGLCLENWKLRKLVVYDQKASQKGNHSEL